MPKLPATSFQLSGVDGVTNYKYVILKFHDHSVTYFGDKQAGGVMHNAKVEGYRLWYELPVGRNRGVMASFKAGDSGGLPC